MIRKPLEQYESRIDTWESQLHNINHLCKISAILYIILYFFFLIYKYHLYNYVEHPIQPLQLEIFFVGKLHMHLESLIGFEPKTSPSTLLLQKFIYNLEKLISHLL